MVGLTRDRRASVDAVVDAVADAAVVLGLVPLQSSRARRRHFKRVINVHLPPICRPYLVCSRHALCFYDVVRPSTVSCSLVSSL